MLTRPQDPWLYENELAVKEVLKRFTYKPGWKFSADQGFLVVIFETIDANKQDLKNLITFTQPIPRHLYSGFDWARWLFDQVREVELHETKEFFRIDGTPVYDPHPELAGKTHEQV